jgi:ABC-type lipoprotein export system ATPase subunit
MEQQRVAVAGIVMDILRRLAHEENRCVIVVTHDPEVADTADLVLRMKDGVLTAAKVLEAS